MKRRNRIFYIGMITTDIYGKVLGQKTYSGAAARKMTSVAHAMRSVGHRVIIVSLPFVGPKAMREFYPAVVTSEGNVPAVFLATLRSRYFRKIFGPFFLASFALRRIEPSDTVILYNHALEYLPALLVLKLMGVKVVQDIEDAPRLDESGLWAGLNWLSFLWTFRLTEKRKMVVADHVARGLELEDYVVVRGVATHDGGASHTNLAKWEELRAGGELRLHFGGTLVADTGVDLFCEAFAMLAQDGYRLDRRVIFKVTGVGELEKVQGLQNRTRASPNVHLEVLPELSKDDYVALIDLCHGSLSLKRPGSGMSNTTFPSKVIEITAAGLALVSTRLGDVTSLFNDESAFFLSKFEAVELVDVIVEMARRPDRVEQVSKAGLAVCNRTFSLKTVGGEMTKLL